jgi:hypothetical protein
MYNGGSTRYEGVESAEKVITKQMLTIVSSTLHSRPPWVELWTADTLAAAVECKCRVITIEATWALPGPSRDDKDLALTWEAAPVRLTSERGAAFRGEDVERAILEQLCTTTGLVGNPVSLFLELLSRDPVLV